MAIKPWIRIGINQKCWIRIRTEINTDPQHWLADSANQYIFDDRLRSSFATGPEQLACKLWPWPPPPPALSTSTVNISQTELWNLVNSSFVFFFTVVELNEFSLKFPCFLPHPPAHFRTECCCSTAGGIPFFCSAGLPSASSACLPRFLFWPPPKKWEIIF